jgi:asparagine synthetase B (glutamine-hydrolysing)
MFGIAGIVQKNVGELDLGFASCLSHRGPDDYGWLCYGLNGVRTGYDSKASLSSLALLVHYRLSILFKL